MMHPKPAKPIRGTAESRRHMAKVAALPCICCGRTPVQVHHVIHGRFSRSRASDFETISLCREHHDELHQHPDRWKSQYGKDREYLPWVTEQIYGSIGKVRS